MASNSIKEMKRMAEFEIKSINIYRRDLKVRESKMNVDEEQVGQLGK